MAELLYRIGRFAARRRGTVVLVWLAILAAAAGAFVYAGGTPNGQISIPGTPTAQVTDRLQAAFPAAAGGTGTIVFHTADGSPITAVQQTAIADRIAQAANGGQHHVSGLARLELLADAASGAETRHDLVAGLFLEGAGDLLNGALHGAGGEDADLGRLGYPGEQ